MSDNIYNFREVENKWKDYFFSYSLSNDEIKNNRNSKKYILEMLPYPSGKLHMGHVRNYTIGDVIARFYDMSGYSVIHPMGWDSFGLPAENAAIKSKSHPKIWTESNIDDMKNQFKDLGYMYDWEREISTCSREYYGEEQKIFLDMFKNGLVYRKKSFVNWDPIEKTVLANEQVVNGRGWRSGAIVEKKMLEQWSIKITKYADELLKGLEDLKGNWPENVLKMQENWIGKSEGANIDFEILDFEGDRKIKIFTTRPDTLFGISFIAISPDHELSIELSKNNNEIKEFLEDCKKNGVSEEILEKMEKKGCFTGLYVKNPLDHSKKVPVYIANFVLIDYGTGAVFGCPAHDERDFEFARKYDLPIRRVIESCDNNNNDNDLPYIGDGCHINSGFLDGLNIEDAKKKMIEYLEENGIGEGKTTFRLRDWLVSRQRYWGCPIPVIHCPKCGVVPVDMKDLPVYLPDDIEFDGSGNPLEKHPTWKYVKCPCCGGDAIRDTDTLDTFFESSWYFLRYLNPRIESPIDREISEISMPVDLYIGGVEHAVLHLLYARFFTLALRDMGYVNITHPFKKLLTQGMVCHKSYKNKDGEWLYPDEVEKDNNGNFIDRNGDIVVEGPSEKMSKSKKNLISPQKIIDSHGVDAVRLFIVSDTPPEKDFDWNTDALDGSWRFLNKIWKTFNKILPIIKSDHDGNDDLLKTTHVYIKKIGDSLESISLNKSVAFIREFFNEIERNLSSSSSKTLRFAFENFIRLLSPITPFICHEMWSILGHDNKDLIWPEFDENLASIDNVTIAVQVRGKLRATFEIQKDSDEGILEERAREILRDTIDLSTIKKTIVVKNRIVNFVV